MSSEAIKESPSYFDPNLGLSELLQAVSEAVNYEDLTAMRVEKMFYNLLRAAMPEFSNQEF